MGKGTKHPRAPGLWKFRRNFNPRRFRGHERVLAPHWDNSKPVGPALNRNRFADAPTGLGLIAQGCRALTATLGKREAKSSTATRLRKSPHEKFARRRNRVAVEDGLFSFPRVDAKAPQPWAVGLSPVGAIGRGAGECPRTQPPPQIQSLGGGRNAVLLKSGKETAQHLIHRIK